MKHRFTYKEPSGTWGVHGEEFKNMSQTIYGAMCKLLDYEETGLSPDDVEYMQYQLKEVHIGMKIQDYEVLGIFNGYCIAFSRKAPDPYVVWTIDDDKCGVHNGRYFGAKAEAVSKFAECAFGIETAKKRTMKEIRNSFKNFADNYCGNADTDVPQELSEPLKYKMLSDFHSSETCLTSETVRKHCEDYCLSEISLEQLSELIVRNILIKENGDRAILVPLLWLYNGF